MRVIKVFVLATLMLGITGAHAHATAHPAKRPLVRLHWHRVAGGVTGVTADDRYVAYGTAAGVTLIDRQTHVTTELPEGECGTAWPFVPFLGGPWLGGCADPQAQAPYTRLYNISGQYWLTVPAQCQLCGSVAVGNSWIELLYAPGCMEHCASERGLQNIGTGQIRADPVQAGARFRLNLDSPTPTSPLCPPLRYPAFYDAATQQVEPGELTMLGQFALATGPTDFALLERCHSHWHRRIFGGVIATSSEMIVTGASQYRVPRSVASAILLPSARRFDFYLPGGPHYRLAYEQVAASGRTIYVLRPDDTLWVAKVPSGG